MKYVIPIVAIVIGIGSGVTAWAGDGGVDQASAAATNAEEEVAINLDDLEEDGSGGDTEGLVPEEPLLPVAVTEVVLDRDPWLALVAVALAAPVALMLLPPRRSRRKRSVSSNAGPKQQKEA